ncbi:MAG: glycosyltransferase family 4 protein [Polyangiales bacterium]
MAEILLVSKPVAPPWNDSGKNLVRDLARGLTRHRPTVMAAGPLPAELSHARRAGVYGAPGTFAPALIDQARVFAYLCGSRGHALWHFFFAPNPRSCRAGALARRLHVRSRLRVLHTLSSAPRDPRSTVTHLFADLNVVLSGHTERRLLEAGLAPDRVRRIAPAIAPLVPCAPDQQARLRQALGLPLTAPLIVFPGDLEFGEGARLMLDATAALAPRHDAVLVMACRGKTAAAGEAEARLRAHVAVLGLTARVLFVGETPRIHDLLACADVVALPSVDLYAKMDYPLVLLEAMSLARAVVIAEGSAAEELSAGHSAIALPAQADALAAGLARLLDDASARSRLGEAARRAVLERYALPIMAEAYERLYDELLR